MKKGVTLMPSLAEKTNGAAHALPEEWELPKPKKKKWRPECPRCESDNVHRSRRRWWERLVGKWIYPYQCMYRCHKCMFRFWGSLSK